MSTAVSTVTGEEVQFLIAKMDRAAPYLQFSKPEDVQLQDRSATFASTTQSPPKHIKQVDSIANHLRDANLCEKGTMFCELGCGTAKLSDHISKTMEGCVSHVLIDRQVFKRTRMRDGAMIARAKEGNTVQRITMDIADITNLASICGENPVVISKHLCGSAADYLIRCCCQTQSPMIVATCCHYLCHWDSFSNTPFFKDLGFTERDFQVLAIVSQWASLDKGEVCTTKSSHVTTRPWARLPVFDSLSPTVILEQPVDSDQFQKRFTRLEKAELGKRCKLFLDMARAYRLQECGYHVKLVRYTTMSMEDHLLVAIPGPSSDSIMLRKDH